MDFGFFCPQREGFFEVPSCPLRIIQLGQNESELIVRVIEIGPQNYNLLQVIACGLKLSVLTLHDTEGI